MARRFQGRAARIEVLPTHGNPYLAHTMLGNYPESALPEYFQASSRDALRGAHSKVDLVRSDLVDAVEGMEETTATIAHPRPPKKSTATGPSHRAGGS